MVPLASFAVLLAAGVARGRDKENLDLPFDALGEDVDDDPAPEVVSFLGTRLEGDGFFYVIDRSTTMHDSGELGRAKSEVKKNIVEFSSRVEFGIVFFDAGILKFPASGQPAEATPPMKQAAGAFVDSVAPGAGTCGMQALITALQLANRARSHRKVIVYLSDGGGTCRGADENQYLEKTIATVTAQNYQRVKINTILVLNPSGGGEAFMRRLAAANGGTYTRLR
jgi:hypothetical protein